MHVPNIPLTLYLIGQSRAGIDIREDSDDRSECLLCPVDKSNAFYYEFTVKGRYRKAYDWAGKQLADI